jgi:monoamine oxidase
MTTAEQVDVVIVGAGLAGLTCADQLAGSGLSVVLLEGGGRVGGRARTVGAPFQSGQVVETGAEWVDTVHRRMRGLLDRFGLEFEGAGQHWTVIRRWLHDGERLWTADELAAANPSLTAELERYRIAESAGAAGITDPSRPQDHPEAAEYDARSLADAIAAADLGPLARLFAERDAQGEFAAEPAEVSLLFVAQQRALYRTLVGDEGLRAHRIAGGVSRVATALAASLPERTMRFGENVRRIEIGTGEAGVITGRGHVFAARHVITTCMLPAMRSIVFDPPLPEVLGAAVAELGCGTVTKTAVQFPERTWQEGYATTSSPAQRMYEPTLDQPGAAGVLMAYTGGDGGRRLAEMNEDERLTAMTAEMRGVHDGLGTPLAGISRAWSSESRYGGSYACYGPGQVTRFWEPLRTPHGPLILAGEHTSTCTGYLEGAVESGERAAATVIAQH